MPTSNIFRIGLTILGFYFLVSGITNAISPTVEVYYSARGDSSLASFFPLHTYVAAMISEFAKAFLGLLLILFSRKLTLFHENGELAVPVLDYKAILICFIFGLWALGIPNMIIAVRDIFDTNIRGVPPLYKNNNFLYGVSAILVSVLLWLNLERVSRFLKRKNDSL